MTFTETALYSGKRLYASHVKMRTALNPLSSEKPTYHLKLHIDPEEISYKPGDTLAILPKNFEEDISCFLDRFASCVDNFYTYRDHRAPLKEIVSYHINLNKLPKKLFAAFSLLETSSLKELLSSLPEDLDLEYFLSLFSKQLPRFYSIASSQHCDPFSIDLMVADLEYEINGIKHKGMGSSYLCERIQLEADPLYLYIQQAKDFCLYEENRPIVLIGPGTGFAPFRSFLQERFYLNHPGENWLFFGARHRKTDFFFEEELKQMQARIPLRIDAAFSRDQEHKIYVQHLMWEHRQELWQWLSKKNAILYVCGDATHMAKDVHATLIKIAQKEQNLSEEEAQNFLKELKKEKRYLLDVY